jgi:hypothetical protein
MATNLEIAARSANDFLLKYSPQKPPRFATGDIQILQPERTIRQALAEAQYILNQTFSAALQRRTTALEKIQRRQRIINGMHLLTGSGFVLLIANQSPEPIKWIGAILGLGAGILGLTIPENANALEKQISEDTDTVSSLSGKIAKIQTLLIIDPDLSRGDMATQIADAIAQCTALATKYGLDQIALKHGFYPRPDSDLPTPMAKDNTNSPWCKS